MSITKLPLTVGTLASEPVLVAAWKKAQNYIRQHNWYADVLELDLANANLDKTLNNISKELRENDAIKPDQLRLVPAPKSQLWKLNEQSWVPEDEAKVNDKLRPLAHSSVRDQIIAMAFVILFADDIETRQGDSTANPAIANARKMVSYGNRLMCDSQGESLRFRWGSTTSYRKYFTDYQMFVSRPRTVVEKEFSNKSNWAIIHADLSRFYDRVRPALLHNKIGEMAGPDCENGLLQRFNSFFNWEWHPSESDAIAAYATRAKPEIANYESIALPQGLVASGFFANAVLLDFDNAMKAAIGKWSAGGHFQWVDYCRYVDDMRIVVRLGEHDSTLSKDDIFKATIKPMKALLQSHTSNIKMNNEKKCVILGSETPNGERPVAAMMDRVAHNTSGVMDLFLAGETLDTLDNLLPATPDAPIDFGRKYRDTFPEVAPDVQDATVARFSAHRFRKVFRQSRPMSEDQPKDKRFVEDGISRQYLDQKAAHFCRRLIERWVKDPSNVRLLRVALDLRPDPKVLEMVISFLTPYLDTDTQKDNTAKRDGPFLVAAYCAAELLKAGATETGHVSDPDQFPSDVGLDKLKEYRRVLAEFAQLCNKQNQPWYLRMQAHLYILVAGNPPKTLIDFVAQYDKRIRIASKPTLPRNANDIAQSVIFQHHYQRTEWAVNSLLEYICGVSIKLASQTIVRVLQEDQGLGNAFWNAMSKNQQNSWRKLFYSHGIPKHSEPLFDGHHRNSSSTTYNLISIGASSFNPFQQEYAVLHLATKLLDSLPAKRNIVAPADVLVTAPDWSKLEYANFPSIADKFSIEIRRATTSDARFAIPDWVGKGQKTGYQLGQLLRVALTGRPDFTLPILRSQKPSNIKFYRPYKSAWLLRRYGLFNGRNAFGPSWLPISSWFGSLLARLLEWPGFNRQESDRISEINLPGEFRTDDLRKLITKRIELLERKYGRGSKTPFLPVKLAKHSAKRIADKKKSASSDAEFYAMRVCVVQTASPRPRQFTVDPELNSPPTRRAHRRHLSSVLVGVGRMLQVRGTHTDRHPGIELLILPELAVHPDDIHTILLPFARQYNCIVCAGIVFHKNGIANELINSAQWILPIRSNSGSLSFEHILQGKCHLTKKEVSIGVTPFRPVQWIFEFISPASMGKKKWAMTGSICYDATDLRLAADLRDVTDMFVVPALNRDVGTFDNMVAALHYHMFQHVIVANSGGYGGSTAQAPFEDRNERTIFHTHGSRHVTISFFDVNLQTYHNPDKKEAKEEETGLHGQNLKTPPAGFSRRGKYKPA